LKLDRDGYQKWDEALTKRTQEESKNF